MTIRKYKLTDYSYTIEVSAKCPTCGSDELSLTNEKPFTPANYYIVIPAQCKKCGTSYSYNLDIVGKVS